MKLIKVLPLLMLLAGASSAAAETVVPVTRFDLVGGRIPAPSDATPTAARVNGCDLAAAAHEWTLDPKKCTALINSPNAASDDSVWKLQLVEDSKEVPYIRTDREVRFDTTPALIAVIIVKDDVYTRVDLKAGATDNGDVVKLFKDPPTTFWALDSDGKAHDLKFTDGGPTPDKSDRPAARERRWCRVPAGMKGQQLVCIDATSGQFEPVFFQPKNHTILPNQSVVVIVHHNKERSVVVTMEGTAGLFEPTVGNYAAVAGEGQHVEPGDAVATTTVSFAPRLPSGGADIHIELRDGANLQAETTIELVVATTYAGAIRLGFAAISGGAVDRAYEARTSPGSSQAEIAATGTGDVNVEVTVGMSAYLFDVLLYGGRRYVDRPIASYLLPSPYIAVGAVAPDAGDDGVRAITSLHIGGEWEFTKNFAVSLTGVARRVTRLSEGSELGMPVASTSSFTEQRYEWGWAVVFSVSPEFMQLARGKP